MLIKTGSATIEATIRRRRILFTVFVARVEDTRQPMCVMSGELVKGAGCLEGQEKILEYIDYTIPEEGL